MSICESSSKRGLFYSSGFLKLLKLKILKIFQKAKVDVDVEWRSLAPILDQQMPEMFLRNNAAELPQKIFEYYTRAKACVVVENGRRLFKTHFFLNGDGVCPNSAPMSFGV